MRPPSLTPKWRLAGQLAAAAVLLAALVPSLWNERYYPVLAVLALAVAAALAWLLDWWRRMPVVAALVLLNLLLIFAYLWSLDESVHITIRTTPKGYVAQVGAGKGTLPRPVVGGSIGLYSGVRESLRVQPTGEAPMPAKQNLLAQFGEWIRLVPSGPAWSNARLVTSNGSRDFSQLGPHALSRARWSYDHHGELQGSPGSLLRLPTSRGNYVFSADLLRSDGAQGMVVGLNHSKGYLLLVRFDQPDGIWTDWRGGPSTDLIGGVPVAENLELIPMIQRDTRLLLGSWVLALILAGLAIPLYLLLAALLRLLPGPGGPNIDFAKSWLSRAALVDVTAGLAAAAALLFTALISSQLLDRMPHVQDSVAYLFQARTFAMGHLSVPAPPLHPFFNQEFIPAFHGRWFSKYPPGWPLLLAVGVLFGAPWLVNPVLAGASLFLLYLIGREVYGRSVALLATLLALSSPFFLFLGGSFMAHTATLFYLTGFAYLFIRWLKRFGGKTAEAPEQGRKGQILLLVAGFLLGMAFITRQLDAIAFAIPFACAFLLWSRRLLSATWAVIGGAIPVLGMLLYDWHLTGSPLRTPYSLWWKFDHLGFGADVGLSGFTVPHGFWNTSINLEFLQAHLLGWPFYFALALVAIPFVLGRFTGWDAVFGASAICIIGSYTFYWNPGIMYGPRYYYVAIPWFALLSARGLQELYRLPLHLPLRWTREPAAALFGPTLLLVLLLAFNLSVYLPAQIPIYRGYNFITPDSVNAVHRARIHHALVFVVENPAWAWWPYGSVFSDMSPMWKDSDRIYVKNKGAANRKLMRLFPGRRYYLLEGTQLYRIGSG